MKGNVLILSCLNGHVAAVNFHGGVPSGRWESPKQIEDFKKFGSVFWLRQGG